MYSLRRAASLPNRLILPNVAVASRNCSTKDYKNSDDFMTKRIIKKNPGQPEFYQAVHEVLESIWGFVHENPHYVKYNILDRITEPERVVMFRVPWRDDNQRVNINRGYRIEFNSALGPYKGGLRFHPSVTLGTLKFLAFEQTFKNSLTTLPMGGGKGGSDFDPKGKSDSEVMSFCQSFMTELFRHIGPNTDVPAGDIGVGGREIGYLFGQYKRIKNEFTGVLTGKGLDWGGSRIRPEATGYGLVYFVEAMMNAQDDTIGNKRVAISGSGNVAQYAAEKVLQMGGKVVTFSDSNGSIYEPDGIDMTKLDYIMDLKNNKRGRISEYVKKFPSATFLKGKRPWEVKCDIALPCATQNEIDEAEAKMLVENGCMCVGEGANMPSSPEAVKVFNDNRVLFAPGKASNAGGVAVSGLEMSQDSLHLTWSREDVDKKLHQIMLAIHSACEQHGKIDDTKHIDYVKGANIAGFIKVADAMIDQGVV